MPEETHSYPTATQTVHRLIQLCPRLYFIFIRQINCARQLNGLYGHHCVHNSYYLLLLCGLIDDKRLSHSVTAQLQPYFTILHAHQRKPGHNSRLLRFPTKTLEDMYLMTAAGVFVPGYYWRRSITVKTC